MASKKSCVSKSEFWEFLKECRVLFDYQPDYLLNDMSIALLDMEELAKKEDKLALATIYRDNQTTLYIL